MKTLRRLNPEEEEPFFFRLLDYELSELEKGNPDLKEITDYTNMALQIDKVARIWIDFVLRHAALKAKSERTADLLNNMVSLNGNDDVITIRLVLNDGLSTDSEDSEKDKKYRLEKLKKRIDELENFSKLSEFLLDSYRKEQEALS